MKKIVRKPTTETLYSTLNEKDADLRNPRPVKRVNPTAQAADIERTRRTGETKKTHSVKGVNDPE